MTISDQVFGSASKDTTAALGNSTVTPMCSLFLEEEIKTRHGECARICVYVHVCVYLDACIHSSHVCHLQT